MFNTLGFLEIKKKNHYLELKVTLELRGLYSFSI